MPTGEEILPRKGKIIENHIVTQQTFKWGLISLGDNEICIKMLFTLSDFRFDFQIT